MATDNLDSSPYFYLLKVAMVAMPTGYKIVTMYITGVRDVWHLLP